jgi:hypothetical protein
MIVAAPTRGKERRRRFHGIGAAARELGVTRHHLFRVIVGERRSPRIEAWLRTNLKKSPGGVIP